MSLLLEFDRCPVCGSRDISLNQEGLLVCRSCGTVVGVAVAAGLLASRKEGEYRPLAGSTDYYWRDVRGVVTPKYKLYEALARRGKRALEAEVERVAALLGLPKACRETARHIAARMGRTNDVEYAAAAVLFLSCRLARIYNDHLFKGYDMRRLGRKVVWVQRKADIGMPPPPPKQFIYRLAEELGLGFTEIKDALYVLDVITPVVGRGKMAQTAALLLSARAHGRKIEPIQIAEAAGISSGQLVEVIKEIDRAFRPLGRSSRRSGRS
ncbi:MAG: TFIIB-type zinc finger domain-containing protein [Thermoproteus sp.]